MESDLVIMETMVEFCFTCLCRDREFIKYEHIDINIASFYERFVADGGGMTNLTQNQNYLCENCCMQLKNSYCFWKQCMHSKNTLENYITELEHRNQHYIMQDQERNDEKTDINLHNLLLKSEESDDDITVPNLLDLDNQNPNYMVNRHVEDFFHGFHLDNHSDKHGDFRNNVNRKSSDGEITIKSELEDEESEVEDNKNFQNMMDLKLKLEETEDIENESKLIDKPFQCTICSHKFVNKGNLKRHLRLHSETNNSEENLDDKNEETAYQCTVCPKKLLTKNNLLRHLRTHTEERSFQCKVCQKTFNQKTTCKRHEESHSRVMVYECDVCKTEYTNLDDFKNHRTLHETDSTLKCQNCLKIFASTTELAEHQLMSCNNETKNFQCDVCPKSFISKQKLKRHMLTHSEEKKFHCMYENCKKKFPDRITFKEHTKTHTHKKSFECDQCSKKFISALKLKEHKNIHLGLKPFQCMICEKYFSHSHSLNMHLKSHTDDKPFECLVCKKRFLNPSSLRQHEFTHNTEPIGCTECDKKFNSRSTFYRHLKAHKEGNIFFCDVCNEKFICITELKVHQKEHAKTNESKD